MPSRRGPIYLNQRGGTFEDPAALLWRSGRGTSSEILKGD